MIGHKGLDDSILAFAHLIPIERPADHPHNRRRKPKDRRTVLLEAIEGAADLRHDEVDACGRFANALHNLISKRLGL